MRNVDHRKQHESCLYTTRLRNVLLRYFCRSDIWLHWESGGISIFFLIAACLVQSSLRNSSPQSSDCWCSVCSHRQQGDFHSHVSAFSPSPRPYLAGLVYLDRSCRVHKRSCLRLSCRRSYLQLLDRDCSITLRRLVHVWNVSLKLSESSTCPPFWLLMLTTFNCSAGMFWLHDTYHDGQGMLSWWQKPLQTALASFTVVAGLFICVAGLYVTIQAIVNAYADGTILAPFACG